MESKCIRFYDHYLLGIPLIPSMQRWRQVQEDPRVHAYRDPVGHGFHYHSNLTLCSFCRFYTMPPTRWRNNPELVGMVWSLEGIIAVIIIAGTMPWKLQVHACICIEPTWVLYIYYMRTRSGVGAGGRGSPGKCLTNISSLSFYLEQVSLLVSRARLFLEEKSGS